VKGEREVHQDNAIELLEIIRFLIFALRGIYFRFDLVEIKMSLLRIENTLVFDDFARIFEVQPQIKM
jgi:hypothetical protein